MSINSTIIVVFTEDTKLKFLIQSSYYFTNSAAQLEKQMWLKKKKQIMVSFTKFTMWKYKLATSSVELYQLWPPRVQHRKTHTHTKYICARLNNEKKVTLETKTAAKVSNMTLNSVTFYMLLENIPNCTRKIHC